jgi:8-oxo-dGTP diphosphatase
MPPDAIVSSVSLFANASVTVDAALITIVDGDLHVLVHRRPTGTASGQWALPGVFVQLDETLDAAASRAIRAKARLDAVFVEQLYTFGDPGRDPRGRVVTVAYYALVPADRLLAALATATDDLRLVRATEPPALAFDHGEIVAAAVERLRGKVGYAPIGYELLPDTFTLRALRTTHEAILGRPLNKDSFRRRILDRGEVAPTGSLERGSANRPAELYRRAPSATGPGPLVHEREPGA